MKHTEYIRIVLGARTAVLMIHGICSTPRHFDFLLPLIPQDASVCNILLAGHGGDVKDFSRATMKDWKQQVQRHLEELSRTHEELIVVGYSLGTLLTLNFFENYPKVKGLLLLNTPLSIFLKPLMIPRSLRISFGKGNPNNMMERAMYEDLSIRLTPYLWRYLPWIPNFVSLIRLSFQCRKKAGRINVPCYALFSEKDEMVTVKSQNFFPAKDQVHCMLFENSSHCYYESEFKKQAAHCLDLLLKQ